jgi:hypothetical protein
MISNKGPKLSRRKFLAGSSVTVASAAVATSGISLLSERAEAFFNMGAFWKKPAGNGQTSNGYTIGQSLRFNGTSTYLARTATSTGNQKTWTWSGWVKKTKNGATNGQTLFWAGDGGNDCFNVVFDTNDRIRVLSAVGNANKVYKSTVARFRDLSAWYHVVLACDFGNATQSSRVMLWVNGVSITSWEEVYQDSLDHSSVVNLSGQVHRIGISTVNNYPLDGYLAEGNFVDGQALDPSYFGQLDTNSGQWIPKAYSGAYGTNGFYLKFADSSDSTAATLGKDSAALGGAHASANNWTPNGFATYDQVLDSPTNNFSIYNPLERSIGYGGTEAIYSSGAQVVTAGATAADWKACTNTIGVTSGKWYAEFTMVGAGAGTYNFVSLYSYVGSPTYVFAYNKNGQTNNMSPNNWVNSWATYAANDIISIALDMSTSTASFYKNNVLQGSWTFLSSQLPIMIGSNVYQGGAFQANFGQGGQTGLTYDAASGGRFKYTPPAGFKALCTANLPSTMPVVTSSTFTGNASADGPFVWLGGSPTDLTINGNTVTWGTHADKLANGFKVRTSSASYNAGSANSFSATVPAKFKWATARTNP